MFRVLVSKYGLALHLAVLAGVPVALTPFLDAAGLSGWIFLLSVFAVLWLTVSPSLRAGETPSCARVRAWRETFRDPIVWAFAAAAAFAAARAFNGGVELVYNPEDEVWSVAAARVAGLPSSAGTAGFVSFASAWSALVLVVGVRRFLGPAARIWFGLAGASVSAVGGLTAAAAAFAGLSECVRLAQVDFTSSAFVGSMFAVWLFVGGGCGIAALQRRWGGAGLPFVVALAGNAVAVALFSPPLLAGAQLAVFAVFSAACLLRLRFVAPVRSFFRVVVLSVCGALLSLACLVPEWRPEVAEAKAAGLSAEKAFSDEREDAAVALGALARDMWRENPWLGVGEGAFPLQAPFRAAEEDDEAALPSEVNAPYNGFLTLLVERGMVGLIVLALAVGALVVGWVVGAVGASRQLVCEGERGRMYWCGLLEPCAVAGAFALACAAADLFFSSAFRNGAFPPSVAAALALAGVSFVKFKPATGV